MDLNHEAKAIRKRPPKKVFALQKGNNAGVSFGNIDEARQYMQTDEYNPDDFVYTDANEQCVYIKKDGAVPDCLMRGHERAPATGRCPSGRTATEEQETGTAEPQR